MRSSVTVTISAASRARRGASGGAGTRAAIGCGNLGAPPKPPHRASNDRRSTSRAAPRCRATAARGRSAVSVRRARDVLDDPRALQGHLVAAIAPRLGDPGQDLPEGRHAVARLGRVVRPGVEGLAGRREERRQRPAAVAVHRLHRVHVDRVEIGPLLAIHLDRDEVLVHERGRLLVLEGLALHHVAPVARRVADREQDRAVLGPRPLQRLLAPGVPVHRVVRVLEQVGAASPAASRFVGRSLTLPVSRAGHGSRPRAIPRYVVRGFRHPARVPMGDGEMSRDIPSSWSMTTPCSSRAQRMLPAGISVLGARRRRLGGRGTLRRRVGRPRDRRPRPSGRAGPGVRGHLARRVRSGPRPGHDRSGGAGAGGRRARRRRVRLPGQVHAGATRRSRPSAARSPASSSCPPATSR